MRYFLIHKSYQMGKFFTHFWELSKRIDSIGIDTYMRIVIIKRMRCLKF